MPSIGPRRPALQTHQQVLTHPIPPATPAPDRPRAHPADDTAPAGTRSATTPGPERASAGPPARTTSTTGRTGSARRAPARACPGIPAPAGPAASSAPPTGCGCVRTGYPYRYSHSQPSPALSGRRSHRRAACLAPARSQEQYVSIPVSGCSRAVTTRSNPAGNSCWRSRNASRIRRLTAFRRTADPTRFPTLKPSRGWSSPLACTKTVSGPCRLEIRVPKTRWNSRALVSRCRFRNHFRGGGPGSG